MSRKQLLTELLQQEQTVEDIFMNGISQEDRDRKGAASDWAIIDVIAHFSYLRNLRAAELSRVVQGETSARIDDIDQENAVIFAEFCDKSWDEVSAFARQSSQAMRDRLQELSEADLELEWRDGQPLWGVVTAIGYSHPLIHISEYYQQNDDMLRGAEITGMLGIPLAGLDDGPNWRGMVHYNVACSYSLMGQKHKAIEELRLALELRPNMAEWSRQDPDLKSARDEPDFLVLYED